MDSFITANFKYSLSHDPILPNILFLHGDLQVDYGVSELQGTFSSSQEMSSYNAIDLGIQPSLDTM